MADLGLSRSPSATEATADTSLPRKKRQVKGNFGGVQRQKVSRACDACKQRKAKCNGTIPCPNCSQRGFVCKYTARYGRGRPPTPKAVTPTSPVPRQPLLSEPQSREGQITSVPPSRASPDIDLTETTGQYVDRTSGLAFLDRASKRLLHQSKATGDGPNSRRWHKESLADLHQDQVQVCAGDNLFDGTADVALSIPDGTTCAELVDFYFNVCVTTYRFLHLPTVHKWLGQLVWNVNNTRPLGHELGDLRAAIPLTVMAISILHKEIAAPRQPSDETEFGPRKSDQLYTVARRLTESATGYPRLESVQARLVQVLYLLHTSRMNQAWYVFGEALQMSAALGLHRRTERSRARPAGHARIPRDYIESQCRKRTFWTAYILDVYLGVILGRPRHFHDYDLDQGLPDIVNDENITAEGRGSTSGRDSPIAALIHHAELARIVARISRSIYALNPLPLDELEGIARTLQSNLSEWKSKLPPILGNVHPSSLAHPFRRQSTALKLAYYHAVMHLTRPFLLQQSRHGADSPPRANHLVFDCLMAARGVFEMIEEMAREGKMFHAFWWTQYVAFCALTVVCVWEMQGWGPNGRVSAKENELNGLLELAETCRYHLGEATASNSAGRRYAIILEEMRQGGKAPVQQDRARPNFNEQGPLPEATTSVVGVPEEQPVYQAASDPGRIQMSNDPLTMQFEPLLWDGWQTTDWLDIDALAFGSISQSALSPEAWLSMPAGNI